MIFLIKPKIQSIESLLYFFAYFYMVIFALDDSSIRGYLAMPWLIYLAYMAYRKKSVFLALLICIFLSTLLYDKSSSKFFHPLVGQEFVLDKELYLTSNNSHITIGFGRTDNNNSIQLQKGEKIKIGAIYRETPIIPGNYHIAIHTPHNHTFKDRSNMLKIKGQFHITADSNNFFYNLGILNDNLTQQYTKIPNAIFKLAYFLYPFLLLVLWFLLFFAIEDIKAKLYMYRVLQFCIYFIAYSYIYFAATNDGFSGFLLGIPYAIMLIYEIRKKRRYKNFHLVFLIFCTLFYFSDRSQWSIKYPAVNKSYTIKNDVTYTYRYSFNSIQLSEPYADDKQAKFPFSKGDTFFVKRQFVTGHSIFEASYLFEISSPNFDTLTRYVNKNRQELENALCQEYRKSNKAADCEDFYIEDKDKFYMVSYLLRRLILSQDYDFSYIRGYQFVADILFLLPFYILVFIFFVILLLGRHKLQREIFDTKHTNTNQDSS